MKSKIFTPKWIDLMIIILILLLFIYDGLFNRVESKTIWGIATVLIIISSLIKLIYGGQKGWKK